MKHRRIPLVVSLIVSLVLTATTRQWALWARQQALRTPDRLPTQNQTSLAGMDSYALALMLGGLRGPLVMVLWTSSEAQKTQHDLEDFDTKVEWIRLLQPEFDSVHVFEIWNKAYNISVMRATLSSKYSDILDALHYARSVDRVRPDDINIVYEIGHVYFDKLGNSTEHAYYRHRVQTETIQQTRMIFPESEEPAFHDAITALGADPEMVRIDVNKQTGMVTAFAPKPYADRLKVAVANMTCEPAPFSPIEVTGDPGWRPTEQERLADSSGRILPQFLAPRTTTPFPTVDGDYNGADLQFLPKYGPYPYGVDTFAIAFNYFSRARLLNDLGQKHLYTSDRILSSQTPLSLKDWSIDELSKARRAEMRMANMAAPEYEASEEVLATRDMDWRTKYQTLIARDETIDAYSRALRLSTDAYNDYTQHIKVYPESYTNFINHVYELGCEKAICQADYDYLLAGTADAQRQKALLDEAREKYTLAIELCGQDILKFFSDDEPLHKALTDAEKLWPQDVPTDTTNTNIEKVPLNRIPAILDLLEKYNRDYFKTTIDQHHDERVEREVDIERASARLLHLGPATTAPATAPN